MIVSERERASALATVAAALVAAALAAAAAGIAFSAFACWARRINSPQTCCQCEKRNLGQTWHQTQAKENRRSKSQRLRITNELNADFLTPASTGTSPWSPKYLTQLR